MQPTGPFYRAACIPCGHHGKPKKYLDEALREKLFHNGYAHDGEPKAGIESCHNPEDCPSLKQQARTAWPCIYCDPNAPALLPKAVV